MRASSRAQAYRAARRWAGSAAGSGLAVDARWRHHGGEAVEQLKRRQDLRAAAAKARFRVVVAEVPAIELMNFFRDRPTAKLS